MSVICNRWLNALTVQLEGVKVKCDVYQSLGGSAVERREVSINVDGCTDTFKCTHYYMLCWPDHGTPRETGTVREIIRAVHHVRTYLFC